MILLILLLVVDGWWYDKRWWEETHGISWKPPRLPFSIFWVPFFRQTTRTVVSSDNWCHFSLLQQFTVLHFFKIRPFTYLSPWMFSASCRSVSMRHLKSAGQDSQYVQSSQISTTPNSSIWKKILKSQFCQKSAMNLFRLDRTPLSLFPKKAHLENQKSAIIFWDWKYLGN